MSYRIFKISEQADRLPIQLLYVSHSSYDKGWKSIQHSHDFVELFYIVKGEGTFIVNNTEHHVKANQVILINSNVRHTEKSYQDSLEYITLGFEGVTFVENDVEKSILTYDDKQLDLLFFMNFLLSELDKKNEQSYLIGQNILEILLVKLDPYQKVTVKESSNKINSSVVNKVKQYIDLHYSQPITLDDLADISHLNKYYLSHTFKDHLGFSPIEYLNETRIKHAKILLESSDFSILEISSFTGFSSQSFFSQRFKVHTQMSPSDYRREMKKKKEDEMST